METHEWEDRALWKQFQHGDVKAFTSIVNKYSNTLYDYGMRFSSNEELVKDCIQDIFYVLWHRKNHLREAPHVKFYLLKALRQKILRELPKWKNRISLEDISAEDVFAVELEENLNLSVEVRHKITSYINQLSPRQRELLYLRFYENLKQDKIAELMGLNRQSAYNLQRRALIALKKLFDKEAQISYTNILYLVFIRFFF